METNLCSLNGSDLKINYTFYNNIVRNFFHHFFLGIWHQLTKPQKMKKLQIALILIASFFSFGQEEKKEEKPFKASVYGFARVDYSWDTRQSAQVREYHLNLWPLDIKNDTQGNDINATGASNFLSVVSRLGVKASGPDVWGAKVTGVLEGDFFGNTQQTIALFRLRHAYAKLDWEKTSLTFGQTWYPHFIPEVFPGVANFSTGIPFNPFGWATQFRLDQKLSKDLTFSFTAYKDREFGAIPADGNQNSAVYNSLIPSLNGKFEFRNKSIIYGLSGELRPIKPLIESNGLKSEEVLYSPIFFSYFKYNNEKFHLKAYGITGDDLTHLVMLGGYASIQNGANPVTYKGIRTNAIWIDLASNNKKTAPGFFFGYTNQEGFSGTADVDKIFARGLSTTRGVKDMWRASARVDFKQNKFRLTPELEYTAATHADVDLTNLKLSGNENKVGNFRATVSAVYSF